MPRSRNHKKGQQKGGSSEDELDDGRYDQYDDEVQGAGGGGRGGPKKRSGVAVPATVPVTGAKGVPAQLPKRRTTPPKAAATTELAIYSTGGATTNAAPSVAPKKHHHEDPNVGLKKVDKKKKLADASLSDSGARTNNNDRFTHGINVYNRILHDVLPACDWELAYEDRFKGLLWMPVEKFRHTGDETREIPFHRVYKYRYRGVLAWDRIDKVDLLDEVYGKAYKTMGGAGNGGGGGGVLPPLNLLPCLKSVPRQKQLQVVAPSACIIADSEKEESGPGKFERGEQQEPQQHPELSSTIKLATFNVLFDIFQADQIHSEKRLPLICKALEETDADLIALQELTPKIYKNIRSHSSLLCSRYYWSTLPTDVGTCQAVLSKEPMASAVSCQMSKNKRCIFVSTSVKATPVAVAAVHLISDHGGEVAERRKGELETISKALAEHPNAVMLGDFNFGDLKNPHENGFIKNCTFADCFVGSGGGGVPTNYDGTPENDVAVSRAGGYFTFDMIKNPIARATCKEDSVPRRLDRILVRGFQTKSYGLFANTFVETPVSSGKINLYPSDHFGVFATVVALEPGGGIETAIAAAHGTSKGPEGETAAAMGQRLAPNFFSHHGTALCIILPEHLHEPVNAIRRLHDKAYPRWMPHINLMFPFVSPNTFSDAVELITRALEEVQPKPFKVGLKKVGHFNARKPVMFLQPETDPSRPLHQLHAVLQELFPLCRRIPARKSGGKNNSVNVEENEGEDEEEEEDIGYQPHATLGQVEPGKRSAFEAAVHAQWIPAEFTVDCLYLIAKLEGSDRYEVMNKFDFPSSSPTAAAVAGGGSSIGTAVAPRTNPEDNMVLENPKYGNRKLSSYLPQDPLELWMLQVSRTDLARVEPTHISQRGGMYHIPQYLLDTYLQRWAESVQLCREVKFYMEEVRTAGAFRLYLDLDIKLCNTRLPYDGSPLCRTIIEFTEVLFAHFATTATGRESSSESNNGGGLSSCKIKRMGATMTFDSLLETLFFSPTAQATLKSPKHCKHRATVVDATCLVTECHTTASDGKDETVTFKSGYRMYFQRIFVTAEHYQLFVGLLCAYLKRQTTLPVPESLPHAYKGWDEVIDTQGAAWDRARMFGSVKRRNQHKDVQRIHKVHRLMISPGLVLATNDGLPAFLAAAVPATTTDNGRLGGLIKEEEDEATAYYKKPEHLTSVLYAQEVRIWDRNPVDTTITYCNNQFSPQRLYGVWVKQE